MKRLILIVLSLILTVSMLPPAMAVERETVISRQETVLENGVVVVDTLVESTSARALGKTAKRTKEVYNNNVLIARITMVASFQYDGTTVSVSSMGVTQKDTYEGWRYVENSLTASGGTATLDAKLTKLLVFNIPVTITITCDANGNLS